MKILITGTRKGIGLHLARNYAMAGHQVIGCSRAPFEETLQNYEHFQLDVSNEAQVKKLFLDVRSRYGHIDALINNAGIASMNHSFVTPMSTLRSVFETNFFGTFLFCREAAKLMSKQRSGRIVNFSTVAVPLRLEGEAVYAASKAAVVSLTQVLAKEFGSFGITVNAVGPTPVETDLIRNVPQAKIDDLIRQQGLKRMGTFADVENVVSFFLRPESSFVSGQVIYLGGISGG